MPAKTMDRPHPDVTVRMYRQGLGDCFLVTFSGSAGPVNMLIDCGVIQGAKDAAVMMKQVVEDVRQTAKGRLDVVVATHEHWDHLSGFSQASEIFQKITMGEIWLAWTEQPENPRAKELKDEFGLQLNALIRAVRKWGAAGLQPLLYQSVVQVASFFGDVLSAGGVTTQDALKQLTTGPHGSIRYLTPGQEPFKVPGVDGVRVYVLGPPADAAYVKRLLPRKGEAYELRMNAARALLAALGPQGEGDDGAVDEWRRQAAPFDEYYMISTAQAQSRSDDFFRKYYGFGQDPADPWRRIDDDWLTSAGQLALDLDSWTNNTSLVLAFELVATGDVLLFAGDAQIGNWASWQDLSFSVKDAEGKTAVVTSADLLQRTVFYKVGHHASHNATLRLEGLELMKSPDLVAMIPVNEQTARAKRWNMPFPPLLQRLQEKCRGRVIRQDEPIEASLAAAGKTLQGAELDRYKDSTGGSDLFVQCRFPL